MKTLIVGDALEELRKLPAEIADCCITSPPYYQLRDYGVEGQIGLEETVEEYIEKLVAVFREVRRVLKKDGTLWVNIADSYAGSGKGAARYPENAKNYKQGSNKGLLASGVAITPHCGCKSKDLLGVPWILALALRNDGWFLRQDIIWQKSNTMPESVRDRCTKAHEYIFLLSKSKKYYFDYRAIQEPCVGFDKSSPRGSQGTGRPNAGRRSGNRKSFYGLKAQNETGMRNKRSVWTVAASGGNGKHFATFPKRLIEPCVLAGSRSGGVVLDPFAGTGTTCEVAAENGRGYIGIDLNEEYLRIAEKRL